MQEAIRPIELRGSVESQPVNNKVKYGQFPKKKGFTGESGLEYTGGNVSAINLAGNKYEVKTADITFTSEEFFEKKAGAFTNANAASLYDTLKRNYHFVITEKARKAELAELHMQLSKEEITEAISADREYEKALMVGNDHDKEFFELAEEYLEKHIQDWITRKIPVTLHSFVVPKLQMSFRRLIVGNIDPAKSVEFWRIDEEAVRALHFADKKLGLSTGGLTVFEIADFGNDEQNAARAESKESVLISPITDERNGNVGCFNGKILIFDYAKQLDRTGNGFQPEIHAPDTARHIKHEIAHAVDKYKTIASLGMAEGFARAMEFDFNPERIRPLYRYGHFKGNFTMGKLVHAVEGSRGEEESILDFYNITGAFLAFLYGKLHNPKKFMDFYGLITGNRDVKRRVGLLPPRAVEIHDPAMKTMTIYNRGIINSLDYCLQGTGMSTDQFIKEFLAFMNS